MTTHNCCFSNNTNKYNNVFTQNPQIQCTLINVQFLMDTKATHNISDIGLRILLVLCSNEDTHKISKKEMYEEMVKWNTKSYYYRSLKHLLDLNFVEYYGSDYLRITEHFINEFVKYHQ